MSEARDPMSTDLSALRARVEEAKGPDREIDAEICAELRFLPNFEAWKVKRAEGEHGKIFAEGKNVIVQGDTDTGWFSVRDYAAPVTASLDAALGLVEAKLPGWGRDVDATAPEMGIDVTLHDPRPPHRAAPRTFKGTHNRETHATLIALLSALETQ